MKIGIIILVILLAAAGVVMMGAWSMFGTKITAAKSVKKLDDKLYWMEFIGDYGFDEYLAQGGASSESEMAQYIMSFLSNGFVKAKTVEVPKDFGCSTLVAGDEAEGFLMGRNYDWEGRKSQAMIIHTNPKSGYESYSTCGLDFLGFGENWKPEGMQNQYMALAAIYVPLDGMNEKGLCIADLICGLKPDETHQTGKAGNLTTTSAIRLLLDKAADVDEAIELLSQYNMHASVGMSHHLAIADTSGKAVVVEYVNQEMKVIETNIVTNHALSFEETDREENVESYKRWDRLQEMYKKVNGSMMKEEMKESMATVSYENITQWSIVYDMKNALLDFYWQREYDSPYHFEIKED